jgi:carbamoyltransferase
MTLTCGLKLTHDGAVAVCRDDVLLFSVEVEKLDNNARYGTVHDTALIEQILKTHGLSADQIDRWVVDGWDGRESGVAELDVEGVATAVTVAPYRETDAHPDPLEPRNGGSLVIGGAPRPFTSYVHIAGHIMSAYCTSEAARRSEDSFVLVWDGGLFPRLYFVQAGRGVSPGRELFPLTGHTYATAAHHFGPYRRERPAKTVDDLAVAGKLMAYTALGEPSSEVRDVFLRQLDASMFGDSPDARAYRDTIGGFGSNSEPSLDHINAFFTACRRQIKPTGVSDEDVLATFHHLLEELLVDRVRRAVLDWKGPGPWNLCFVGGCALNIKWNSALRAQRDLFSSVWVPPFPNDSGSAIGTAVAEIHRKSPGVVHWSVDAGPALPAAEDPLPGWRSSELDVAGLAKLLHEAGEPIVTLHGRSELGPRALGSRSILAPATNPEMKDRLNEVKDRESYRPVAPICLEDEAPEIFDPGTPDPYMLFDHEVRPEWRGKVPAIVHLDGTARLQTVSADTSPFLHELLTEYADLSGIPVLCNTSANFHGCGFFPDATSAMRWGRVPRVWSNGTLYEQDE